MAPPQRNLFSLATTASAMTQRSIAWRAISLLAIISLSIRAPVYASPLPSQRRQSTDQSPSSPQLTTAPASGPSQALIIGLSAGISIGILAIFALVLYWPASQRRRQKAFLHRYGHSHPHHIRPEKPYIRTTTTTTVIHSRSASTSNDSVYATAARSTESLTTRGHPQPPPAVVAVPMTRIHHPARPPLSPLAESSAAQRRQQTTMISVATPASWGTNHYRSSKAYDDAWGSSPQQQQLSSPPSSGGSGSSELAGRRGRPALQSIQVPAPRTPVSVTGKGKSRVYYY